MAKYRQGRLSEEIKKIISDMLTRGKIQDPKILDKMVSVSGVEVTSDGSYATVYISLLVPDEEVVEVFRKCKGLIRKEVASKVKMHHAPDLIFKLDTSMDYGRHISKIIEELGIENDPDREEPADDDLEL